MIVMVCLDEQNGMMFNHRRQSKDRVVLQDMIAQCQGKPLYMNAYSYKMFPELEENKNILVSQDFTRQTEDGAYCLVEELSLFPELEQVEQVVIYKWGRRYPADQFLELDLSQWYLLEATEFKGYSHEKITKEIYTR